MAMATMYGIRNCDTVKKARAWLEQQGVEYRFHDYKALMLAQPSMIKRPLVELRGRLIVGFKPELYQSLQW